MEKVEKSKRLSKVAKEFNVGITTITDFLQKKGIEIDSNPNTKISEDIFKVLEKEYSTDIHVKRESEKITFKSHKNAEAVTLDDITVDDEKAEPIVEDEVFIKNITNDKPHKSEVKVVGKIDLDSFNKKKVEKVVVKEPAKVEVVKEIAEPKPKEVIKEPVTVVVKEEKPEIENIKTVVPESEVKVVGRIDLDALNQKTRPDKKTKEEKDKERRDKVIKNRRPIREEVKQVEDKREQRRENIIPDELEEKDEFLKTQVEKLSGPVVVGRIDLPSRVIKRDVKSTNSDDDFKKKKRKRIKKEKEKVDVAKTPKEVSEKAKPIKKEWKKSKTKRHSRPEVDQEGVDKQVKDTMSLMGKSSKTKSSKYRRDKREAVSQRMQEEMERQEGEKNILKVTEFVSVNEMSSLMNVPINEVISTCMSLGLFVSINQRLDADTMSIVAEEFGFKVEFVTVDGQQDVVEDVDDETNLIPRPPIITVMGHVDHGKTKLLDHIRNTNVIAGEAGGITQHIGAYSVTLDDGRQLTFLDTPGHEAFTAMRARGAQVTDIAIIVIAADDGIMPQTKEAINHAQAAGVPLIFAINKIDKPGANPEKIKEELANLNILVEDWGGKYQSQEIAAKFGNNVDLLLEKVLLEAEMLDLKANPNKNAVGSVIESALDKGRGYITTVLVSSGTLKIGDVVLAGSYYGKVKAMYNERNLKITEAGPSFPALILGINGAPQAGDKFNVLSSEKEAREIANKRGQIHREQGMRTKKHITLDEIGRRLAIGDFKELNVIVKGDVDGSIEALSDSLIKLSTPEIQVNIIQKAVGQISESDVMLASASNAIIIGFQVRPSVGARRLAEKEEIEIRLYSIIYDAIEELKLAMEGMLSPVVKEDIIGSAEIRETFKITKVGTIAGCLVTDGKITRTAKIRLIRDGIVIYTGSLGSLKRFKDEAKEVINGLECGLNIENFNDIKVGDIVEAFEETLVKKKL
ncbi:MAG TPA: translation initiation factor IF-2 [Bacteroidales bacterium]|nr:MAG: translation initiation factor IF-2 [Bacteroidetes bacterium GWF2_33_38]OFY85452.1 MAG: translation initiation factor IF-2 [Bacteroidetes bacterium RIFOXYA2_FULL_33_7]HBF87848.1 translation initiation factor IF-2 [Bacteroidales bacterium]